MSEMKVSGSLAAMFFSTSITTLMISMLVYFRRQLSFLLVYSAAGTWSGIWLYSYIIWIVLWLAGYGALRNRKEAGSLQMWTLFFALLVIVSTLIVVGQLEWASLFE